MKKYLFFCGLASASLLNVVLLQCQQLTIRSETGKQSVLTRVDLEALPHTKVAARVSDTPTTFEGVPLRAVLERAGLSFGESMRGKRLAL